jgi:hypothetical protein
MIQNIIVSGCSYSCVHTDKTAPLGYWPADKRSENISYPNFLKKSLSTNLLDLSMCGYSNTKILKSIYDSKITNEALYVIQLTHLHRMGHYSDSLKSWIDFQPNSSTIQPELNNGLVNWKFNIDSSKFEIENKELNTDDYNFEIEKLQSIYETHLSISYNEEKEFEFLLYQCDLLKEYLEKSKNKVLFLMWPTIKNIDEQLLDDLNFLKIEGGYSIQEWSVKNNLLGTDAHLNPEGHEKLSNEIVRFIGKYLDNSK